MNQIISSKNDVEVANLEQKKAKKKKNYFKIQFIIFSCLTICVLVYYLYLQYDKNKNEQLSQQIVDNFNITNLYQTNPNTNASKVSVSTIYTKNDKEFSVVGLIEIPSLQINYPIIGDFTMELLKIAPCKFFGPNPNELGNVCIAAHNYNNYKFFSRLKDLKIGDPIYIYDLSQNKMEYLVTSSYETDSDDLSCMNQDTKGKREITLITCNNIKNKRRIIKAIQKG